jgi:hypothetical protein
MDSERGRKIATIKDNVRQYFNIRTACSPADHTEREEGVPGHGSYLPRLEIFTGGTGAPWGGIVYVVVVVVDAAGAGGFGAGIVYVVVVVTGGDAAGSGCAPTTTSGSTTGIAAAMGGMDVSFHQERAKN